MTAKKRITVIDHGTGNLFSVARAIEHLGGDVEFVSAPEGILGAERLVLPGVGAFGLGMQALERLDLVDALREAARDRPLLGICLGMQMLFDGSDEMGSHGGLGLVPGWVKRLPEQDETGAPLKVPHIGWNTLLPVEGGADWNTSILAGLKAGEPVYFVHSFVPTPEHRTDWLARTVYGGRSLAVAVQHENVTGCQFHPERSGPAGLMILDAFLNG